MNEERLRAARARMREALASRPRRAEASPPPRYDDVYADGARWLDGLASPPPHAHPRDEAPVLAHEARGAVGDEERDPEGNG